MITKSFILLVLTVTLVLAQIDGEFWWLNEKLDKYRVRPPEPQFEDLEDWETDESVKIVFRDDNILSKENSTNINDNTDSKVKLDPVLPTKKSIHKRKFKVKSKLIKPIAKETGDTFVFTYPSKKPTKNLIKSSNGTVCDTNYGNTEFINNIHNRGTKTSTTTTSTIPTNLKDQGTQSICTFIKTKECNDKNGTVHYFGFERNQNKNENDNICCILPLPSAIESHDFSRIYFPDMIKIKPFKRSKRSEHANVSLNQRKFLLKQKISTVTKNRSSPTTQTKIVTSSDDYVDPYWNIKNSNFQTGSKQKDQTGQYDDYSEEYSEYAAELPRPGLIGLYSDHAKSPSSLTFIGTKGYGSSVDYDDEDNEEETFGYSTIDPRKGDNNKKQKVKPLKSTTTSSGEIIYNAESATINFQSNPDFQVLRGFKLLNLVTNKSKVFTRGPIREKYEDDKETSVLIDSAEEDDEFFEEDQLFGGCGKSKAVNERDKQTGPTVNGSHPWSALVVLTKRRQNILCYATLIHPRAAITVADCVDGTSPKDITVIAGLWNLNDRSTSRNRVATVHIHPKYKAGDVDNNLAILYWMRPLRLSMNVQPACLAEPHVGDKCKFFGWGTLEDGIQPRSKWQRATIKPCVYRRLNKRGTQLSEAFCATVSRNAVTGMGGPLICDNDGHSSIVGVVVSREDGYELAPIREFALKSNELLKGD